MRTCVYCVNENLKYFKMLFNSILMLKKYNSQISIKIIYLGLPNLKLQDFCLINNVEIIHRNPIEGYDHYFPINKKYVSNIDSDSLLFIDCDTFIFGDVNLIFDFYQNYDFVACRNSWVYGHQYQDSFLKNNISPFNSGIMLFNNYSQFKIYENFDDKFKLLHEQTTPLGKWLFSSGNQWTIEEFTVSQCVTDLELNISHFEREHCYNIQWPVDFDKMHQSIIFHTYTNQWETAFRKLTPHRPKLNLPKKILKISTSSLQSCNL